MTRANDKQVEKDTPEIVYKEKTEKQTTKSYNFGFTITKEQSDWIKENRGKINLSATMRAHLDKIITSEKSISPKSQ